MKNFEMAYDDDPEGIIKSTQRAIISSMRDVIKGIKEDINAPGLTWEQIEYLLDGFAKKEPTIIKQEHEG